MAGEAALTRSKLDTDTPVFVQKSAKDSKASYQAVIGAPIGQIQLSDLCNAPSKQRRFSVNDIRSDWEPSQNPNWQLRAIHETMGEPWEIFSRHRAKLLALLTVQDAFGLAQKDANGQGAIPAYTHEQTMEIVSKQWNRPALTGKDASIEVGKQFTKIGNVYVSKNRHDLLLKRKIVDSDVHHVEYAWRLEREQTGPFHRPVFLLELTRSLQRHSLAAITHWEKSDHGERRFVTGEGSDEPLSPIPDELVASPYVESVDPSSMAGIITTAAMAPDITQSWPATMSLPGAERTQYMFAAQIPVLALMMRKQLLRSQFIERLEAVVD